MTDTISNNTFHFQQFINIRGESCHDDPVNAFAPEICTPSHEKYAVYTNDNNNDGKTDYTLLVPIKDITKPINYDNTGEPVNTYVIQGALTYDTSKNYAFSDKNSSHSMLRPQGYDSGEQPVQLIYDTSYSINTPIETGSPVADTSGQKWEVSGIFYNIIFDDQNGNNENLSLSAVLLHTTTMTQDGKWIYLEKESNGGWTPGPQTSN